MAIGQILYNVLLNGEPTTTNSELPTGIDFTNTPIIKLGIQAPPGTKFKINKDEDITIGRTGIYEIQDVEITHLQVIEQPIYQKDPVATSQAMVDATRQIKDAITKLAATSNSSVDGQVAAHFTYLEEFEVGYRNYLKGTYGVYDLSSTENQDIVNIIIDYECKGGVS